MDESIKIMFAIAGEILFLFNLISLIRGSLRLRQSGAAVYAEKSTWLMIYALAAFSLLAQIGFFLVLGKPNYYLIAMVSGFAALYPNVMASECIFAVKDRELWFGVQKKKKGDVKYVMEQQRRRKINVLLEERGGKQFVLRTTPALWEEIKKHI